MFLPIVISGFSCKVDKICALLG